jgi:PLP dependent protein
MTNSDLHSRLAEVRERIAAALQRVGRPEGAVTIVAVTKTYPPETIRAACAAGLTEFGENRVQELVEKVEQLGRDAVKWHLIGHLQRNKAKRAAAVFDLLHSLDSLRLARELSSIGSAEGSRVHVLLQVNTSGEGSKTGLEPDRFFDEAAEICSLPGLNVQGLMTMAPFTDDEAVLRRTFAATRRLWGEAASRIEGFSATHLSMGMSNDYQIAVEEGSTLVRLGTVLFGARPA